MFKKYPNLKDFLILILLVLVILVIGFTHVLIQLDSLQTPASPIEETTVEAIDITEEILCTPVPCEPVPCTPVTEEVSTTTGWIGDDFGPEKPLPDIVTGPAIANIWNQKTGFCATVKIDEGIEFNYKHSGGYWEAGSQEALDARWPHHRQEYINEPSLANCQALTDISIIPQQ